jgi:2-haloacid dehalogenase
MLDFARFRILTFDCYGTLIDWESGILSVLQPLLAAHGKKMADSDVLQLYSELELKAEQGEFLPYRKVLQSVVGGFGERLGFAPTDAQVRKSAPCQNHSPTGSPFPTQSRPSAS